MEYFSYPAILGILAILGVRERTGASICPAVSATVQLPHISLG